MTINCPITKIKGDVRIDGDLYIVNGAGEVKITSGTVTASVDAIAGPNDISLVGHTHKYIKPLHPAPPPNPVDTAVPTP